MNNSTNPLRVLVVEDDADFARVLILLLKQRFAAVAVVVTDCSSTRKALSTDAFHLITLDFKLPDGNGLELLEEITAVREHPPVIMVTGHGDEKTASEAIRLGADGYVVKDHRMHALLCGAVEKVLEREQYRKALLDGARQYRELVELANSIILKMDGEGNVLSINRYGSEFFEYSEEELIGRNVVGTIVPEVESTGRGLSAMIKDIVSDPDAHRSNFNENMLRDGKRVWIIWGNRSIRDENGDIVGTLSIGNDVTELQRTAVNLEHLTALYSLMISIVRKLMRPGDPQVLFHEVCKAVVESGLFKMAWIGLLDKETGGIVPIGSAGNDDYLDRINVTLNAQDWLETGPDGTVAREQGHHIFNDILRDARMEPWWEEAITCGYCSSAAFPLLSGDRTIGILNLYAGTPGGFNDEIISLLESLAQDISLAIESFKHNCPEG